MGDGEVGVGDGDDDDGVGVGDGDDDDGVGDGDGDELLGDGDGDASWSNVSAASMMAAAREAVTCPASRSRATTVFRRATAVTSRG